MYVTAFPHPSDLPRRLTFVPVTPGPGYLEALQKPNVDFISQEIVRVTETGIVSADGTLREVDAIIWATGFNVWVSPNLRRI